MGLSINVVGAQPTFGNRTLGKPSFLLDCFPWEASSGKCSQVISQQPSAGKIFSEKGPGFQLKLPDNFSAHPGRLKDTIQQVKSRLN